MIFADDVSLCVYTWPAWSNQLSASARRSARVSWTAARCSQHGGAQQETADQSCEQQQLADLQRRRGERVDGRTARWRRGGGSLHGGVHTPPHHEKLPVSCLGCQPAARANVCKRKLSCRQPGGIMALPNCVGMLSPLLTSRLTRWVKLPRETDSSPASPNMPPPKKILLQDLESWLEFVMLLTCWYTTESCFFLIFNDN